jgi:hypothetical protein
MATERDGRPRKISDVIAAMKASGANAVVDEDFARGVEEAIRLYGQPWRLLRVRRRMSPAALVYHVFNGLYPQAEPCLGTV